MLLIYGIPLLRFDSFGRYGILLLDSYRIPQHLVFLTLILLIFFRYWMHNNMITINGQKTGKSLGNFITLEQFFTGNHDSLEQAYSPMTIRFFILSAHYRSTVDFSNDALKASQKGLERLMNGLNDLERVPVAKQSDEQVKKFVSELRQRCYDAMNDDFQTQLVISYLFEACHVINTALDHKANICLSMPLEMFLLQIIK